MNVGLVLSGAMAKGAYEIGALKAISEFFSPDQIQYISAASIGGINAYAFSCNRLDYAYEMWRGINKQYSKLFVKSVMSSDYFSRAISEVVSDDPVCKKLYVSLLNLTKRSCDYVNVLSRDKERRIRYLKATMAFMPLVKPVRIGKKSYIDGAFVDNIPIYPLMRHKLDYVICVHFDKSDYTFESPSFDKRIIKIVFNDDHERLSKSLWITREGTEQMLEDGYKKTKHILSFIFSDGMDNRKSIYEKIAYMNSLKPKNELRLTGDIVINNIAKLTRTITKSKVID